MSTQLTLRQTKAPSIPTPPVEYSQSHQNQLTNVFRLYFNEIDNFTQVLAGPLGGEAINNPSGFVYDTTSQTLTAANTAKAVTFGTNYFNNAIVVVGGSKLTANATGIYNFDFTANLQSTTAASKTVQFWVRYQGSNVKYSARPVTIAGVGTQVVVGTSFSMSMTAGQYLEIIWASPDTGVALQAIAPSAPYPGTASAFMGITFVSNTLNVMVNPLQTTP